MRLTCWPFEVEGQGADAPASAADPAPPPPATPGVASAPVPAEPPPAPGAPPRPTPPPRPALPPSLPLLEQAHYDISYGILGTVGALEVSAGGVDETVDGARIVKVHGSGAGAVIGLGGMQRRIDADFDPAVLGSRSWIVRRGRDGHPDSEAVVDTASRGVGGALRLERLKPGTPPSRETAILLPTIPTSDPLGVLWRLRTAPPPAGTTETLQLLDGMALWRVRVTAAPGRELLPDAPEPAIRLDGEVAPILYDGRSDPERPTRRFTLWLGEGSHHLPLRLEVPFGIADIVMTLTETKKLAVTPRSSSPAASAPVVGPGDAAQLAGPAPGARIL